MTAKPAKKKTSKPPIDKKPVSRPDRFGGDIKKW